VPELKYNKGTDSEHEIKLDSQLIYAAWRRGHARAGGTASFEVGTAFVGNGAKIKITGKSDGRTKLGKISDEIKNNKYIGEFEIPEDAEIDDMIYFEVKLSKNGLSGESNRIPVLPPVVVSDMKWSAEEARRGDLLTLSAKVQGCDDGDEGKLIIYEYDRDGVHDRITEIPIKVQDNKIETKWEYEYHEDTDEIPTDEELREYGKSYNPPEYFFLIEIDGQRFGEEQESGLLEFKDSIEIELSDAQGNPIAEAEYKIIMADGRELEGKLDKMGTARIAQVPPGRFSVEFKDIPMVGIVDEQSIGASEGATEVTMETDDE